MRWQRFLGWLDVRISSLFKMTSSGTGPDGNERWTYFPDYGKRIGIVGVDGRIHTMMGYWAIHHYYENNKLARRVAVRNDLQEGERLATQEEIDCHTAQLIAKFSRPAGIIDYL